jgi:hypothetical protein
MHKINTAEIEWQPHGSATKKFFRDEKKISEALGRKPLQLKSDSLWVVAESLGFEIDSCKRA